MLSIKGAGKISYIDIDKEHQRLAAIIETQSVLAQASFDLTAFMELAVQRIAQITSSNGAVVEMIDGEELVYRAASGRLASFVGMRLNAAGSLSGLCIHRQKVLLCEDTEIDHRVDKEACKKLGIASMVVAPLFSQGKAVGALKISSDKKAGFTQTDVQTLEMIAGLLGAAMAQQAQNDALRLSERHTRLIIESAHDGFICMDSNGIILEWNRQAEHMYGWCKEEAIGRELAELILPEDRRSGHRAGVQSFAQTGKSSVIDQRLEMVTVHRSGRRVLVELSLSSVKVGDRYIANAFVRDISLRKEVEQQLIHLARYDGLTGLANRRYFEEKLDEAMARSARHGLVMALMFMDIDHFKQINDTYGHAGGDEALIEFASRISKSIRETDMPARLAGDEFVVIYENIKKQEEIHIIAEKILRALQEPLSIQGRAVSITASIGVALYQPGCTASELLAQADKALYQAKSKGRYQYAMAERNS